MAGGSSAPFAKKGFNLARRGVSAAVPYVLLASDLAQGLGYIAGVKGSSPVGKVLGHQGLRRTTHALRLGRILGAI